MVPPPLPAAQQPYSGVGRLAAEVAKEHTMRQATRARPPLDTGSGRRRDLWQHKTPEYYAKKWGATWSWMLYCSLMAAYHKEKWHTYLYSGLIYLMINAQLYFFRLASVSMKFQLKSNPFRLSPPEYRSDYMTDKLWPTDNMHRQIT